MIKQGLALMIFIVSCTAQKVTKEHWTGSTEEEKLAENFPWFNTGYANYLPDTSNIQKLKKQWPEYSILVFAGVWCEDTRKLLPQFYKTTDLSGLPRERIELYLLDRKKKSSDRLEQKYSIEVVPVFILLKNGKEVGRIIENVKVSIEADLATLIP